MVVDPFWQPLGAGGEGGDSGDGGGGGNGTGTTGDGGGGGGFTTGGGGGAVTGTFCISEASSLGHLPLQPLSARPMVAPDAVTDSERSHQRHSKTSLNIFICQMMRKTRGACSDPDT